MDVAEDVEAEECQREDWSSLFLKWIVYVGEQNAINVIILARGTWNE
jgi:hypothetical protein